MNIDATHLYTGGGRFSLTKTVREMKPGERLVIAIGASAKSTGSLASRAGAKFKDLSDVPGFEGKCVIYRPKN